MCKLFSNWFDYYVSFRTWNLNILYNLLHSLLENQELKKVYNQLCFLLLEKCLDVFLPNCQIHDHKHCLIITWFKPTYLFILSRLSINKCCFLLPLFMFFFPLVFFIYVFLFIDTLTSHKFFFYKSKKKEKIIIWNLIYLLDELPLEILSNE